MTNKLITALSSLSCSFILVACGNDADPQRQAAFVVELPGATAEGGLSGQVDRVEVTAKPDGGSRAELDLALDELGSYAVDVETTADGAIHVVMANDDGIKQSIIVEPGRMEVEYTHGGTTDYVRVTSPRKTLFSLTSAASPELRLDPVWNGYPLLGAALAALDEVADQLPPGELDRLHRALNSYAEWHAGEVTPNPDVSVARLREDQLLAAYGLDSVGAEAGSGSYYCEAPRSATATLGGGSVTGYGISANCTVGKVDANALCDSSATLLASSNIIAMSAVPGAGCPAVSTHKGGFTATGNASVAPSGGACKPNGTNDTATAVNCTITAPGGSATSNAVSASSDGTGGKVTVSLKGTACWHYWGGFWLVSDVLQVTGTSSSAITSSSCS